MSQVYLFDWGDTLMVDFPEYSGKMCEWEKVETVKYAYETLEHLSLKSKIYIATGASSSSENDIQNAFKRVKLDKFITGYYCKSNLGIEKGTVSFFRKIVDTLNANPSEITMVGDNFERDIKPALLLGLNAVLLTNDINKRKYLNYNTITSLKQLCK